MQAQHQARRWTGARSYDSHGHHHGGHLFGNAAAAGAATSRADRCHAAYAAGRSATKTTCRKLRGRPLITLGKMSRVHLETCHPKIQRLITEAARRVPRSMDFTITCGHRGQAEQDAAFKDGRSTKTWPHSLHNRLPSPAIDLAPYPV